jgi:hypothetical protein
MRLALRDTAKDGLERRYNLVDQDNLGLIRNHPLQHSLSRHIRTTHPTLVIMVLLEWGTIHLHRHQALLLASKELDEAVLM